MAKHRNEKSDWAIVAIGIFKLAKSTGLFVLGAALIHWRNKDLGEVASRWITNAWLGRSSIDAILIKLSFMSRKTIDEFAIGSFVYSVLLLIEGAGLCLRKRWAEFLTVGITASLLPFEFYQLYQRATVTGVVITILNLAILAYLIVRLFAYRRELRSRETKKDTR
jgi:uncharacterized membrane protein (DUF2068 family)